MYKSRFLPVGIRDRVQPSVKAGESDMRFRKRSVLWFCTPFIAQIIAYIHCFPHWATSIPFLAETLQIDSADSWLCQDFFQILIFLSLITPTPSLKWSYATCFQLQLAAPQGSPCVCAEPRTASAAAAQGKRRNEDARLWQYSTGKSMPLLLLNSLLRVWLRLRWLLKAKPA